MSPYARVLGAPDNKPCFVGCSYAKVCTVMCLCSFNIAEYVTHLPGYLEHPTTSLASWGAPSAWSNGPSCMTWPVYDDK